MNQVITSIAITYGTGFIIKYSIECATNNPQFCEDDYNYIEMVMIFMHFKTEKKIMQNKRFRVGPVASTHGPGLKLNSKTLPQTTSKS